MKLGVDIIIDNQKSQAYVHQRIELLTLLNVRAVLLQVIKGKKSVEEDLKEIDQYMGVGDKRRAWTH